MSNEVATIDETSSTLDVLPPAQPPSLAARQMLVAHADMMNTAYDLADKMCRTELVPARFRNKPEDATAAILYGAELGLNPIQSLQRIIPIYGMPTLEARTMVALLKSRGYKVKTREQSDDSVTVVGFDIDGEEYESTWTIARATKAGYVPEKDEKTGKYRTNSKGNLIGNEKYLTDPQAMLKAKAQAEVCRDMAPEILLGISYTAEEMESERFDNSPPPSQRSASAPITVEEIMTDEPAQPEQPEQQPVTDEPGQDGGNDATQEAQPSSASTKPESRDQDEPEQPPLTGLSGESGYDTPDPEDEPRANPAQLRKLSILRKKEGYDDNDQGRADWFAWVEVNIGRLVASNKDLYFTEASVLLDVLESAQAQDNQ